MKIKTKFKVAFNSDAGIKKRHNKFGISLGN